MAVVAVAAALTAVAVAEMVVPVAKTAVAVQAVVTFTYNSHGSKCYCCNGRHDACQSGYNNHYSDNQRQIHTTFAFE